MAMIGQRCRLTGFLHKILIFKQGQVKEDETRDDPGGLPSKLGVTSCPTGRLV
jgi:hypothetical protein